MAIGTRESVYDNEAITGAPCPVEDIEEDPDYLQLPDDFDLGLNRGHRQVWRFVGGEIPGLEPKVREIFSRKGAYRRWKDFLHDLDLLDKWHAFEDQVTRQALLNWCEASGVPMADAPPPGTEFRGYACRIVKRYPRPRI